MFKGEDCVGGRLAKKLLKSHERGWVVWFADYKSTRILDMSNNSALISIGGLMRFIHYNICYATGPKVHHSMRSSARNLARISAFLRDAGNGGDLA